MSEYDDTLKEACWTTYWAGYKHGRGVESCPDITKKTARSKFERFWERST